MTTISLITLGRTALTVALLAPAAACAKPADQAAPAKHEAAVTAAGVTLSTFVSRHERKLLAYDTDGDGKVSRAEFVAAAEAGKSDPARRFVKLDTNGDGLLDKTEIEAMLTRRFKRLDTNCDGVLSASERAAVHARKAKDAGDGSVS
ncbi:EF-hand domain-containing protein [Sphingomonas sp. CARO-RG-8B-R24-01]|uniref:EF-hand domain-containing protein n=1 Tax=Sphingomonas sp. CARO-RG-8B-R24-01 TaxID=2914831 RepID=UPI001F56C06F|nr:EF-hand domain-containing protein [Sphingomonas sp. CARO-RG-8B-R24-01]